MVALKTKQALSSALRQEMLKRPIGRITVSMLTERCGINRNTFYYHFADIYDLLRWTMEQDAAQVIQKFDLALEYREAFLYVTDYVRENQLLLACAMDSAGWDSLRHFFHEGFVGIVGTVIDHTAVRLRVTPEPAYRDFLAEAYTHMVSSLLLEWVKAPERRDINRLADDVDRFFQSTLPAALTQVKPAPVPRRKK